MITILDNTTATWNKRQDTPAFTRCNISELSTCLAQQFAPNSFTFLCHYRCSALTEVTQSDPQSELWPRFILSHSRDLSAAKHLSSIHQP